MTFHSAFAGYVWPMIIHVSRALWAFTVALVGLLPLSAAAGVLAADKAAQVSLMPGWRMTDGTHMSAIHMTLAPGWKTYWRAPGDTGIPPQFDWSGSQNVAAVRVLWPRPKVSLQNGMQTIGYAGEVIWPLQVQAIDPTQDIVLKARLDIGVCEDVCLPISLDIDSNLSSEITQESAAIRSAMGNRPVSAQQAGVGNVSCAIAPISDGLRITARITMPTTGGPEVTVFELPDRSIWISQADTERQGNILIASADMVPTDGAPFLLNRSEVRISVLGRHKMVDIRGCSVS